MHFRGVGSLLLSSNSFLRESGLLCLLHLCHFCCVVQTLFEDAFVYSKQTTAAWICTYSPCLLDSAASSVAGPLPAVGEAK